MNGTLTGSNLNYAQPMTASEIRTGTATMMQEELDKSLNCLGGRVQELKARMERILIPDRPVGSANGETAQAPRDESPLAARLRYFLGISESIQRDIEDILGRLDA